jgi:hypothetical protein
MFYASLHKREPNVTKNEENEKKWREKQERSEKQVKKKVISPKKNVTLVLGPR